MAEPYWVFRDFVNVRGENLIRTWLHSLPAGARAEIHVRLDYLATLPRLGRPYVGQLRHDCKGLYEIRVDFNRVRYRPIGYYGPGRRDFTLLVGALEKGDQFEPRAACSTAFDRIGRLRSGEGTTCEHESD